MRYNTRMETNEQQSANVYVLVCVHVAMPAKTLTVDFQRFAEKVVEKSKLTEGQNIGFVLSTHAKEIYFPTQSGDRNELPPG